MRPAGPQKEGSPSLQEDLSGKKTDELAEEAGRLEEELEELRVRYEMYFLGNERREPNRWRDDLKKKVLRLKAAFTRNTGLRFRIRSLHARFLSYERLWQRTMREKEEGTYRRDLFKARLRGGDAPPAEAPKAAPAGAAVAVSSPTAAPIGKAAPPAPPAPPPARPQAPKPGLAEAQMRTLFEAYVAAKRRCNEDVSKLTYEAVSRSVAKQIPELMTRFKAKSVDFKVVIKDGRAILKAIPKT